MMMSWYGGNGWGWGGSILMTVAVVLFVTGVISAVIVTIRYLTDPRGTAASPPGSWQLSAEDLLAGRFARGEIDDDEYRQRLVLLREHR